MLRVGMKIFQIGADSELHVYLGLAYSGIKEFNKHFIGWLIILQHKGEV